MAVRVEYGLWVMPEGNHLTELRHLIGKLSKRYETISFDPHVTVQGDLPGTEEGLKRKTSLLASSLHPYPVHLTRVGYTDQYFRTLFYRVKQTRAVKQANENARRIFGINDGPYLPHLSLLYGSIPLEEKRKIISEIGRDAHVSFDARSIHLVRIRYGPGPKDWIAKRLKEFPFG
jgi:2'-5' RNA ligase